MIQLAVLGLAIAFLREVMHGIERDQVEQDE